MVGIRSPSSRGKEEEKEEKEEKGLKLCHSTCPNNPDLIIRSYYDLSLVISPSDYS